MQHIPAANNIAGMSLLTWIFMYIATIVFKFCSYHRIFLYYILIVDTINIVDSTAEHRCVECIIKTLKELKGEKNE